MGGRQPPERPGRAEFLHCHSSEGAPDLWSKSASRPPTQCATGAFDYTFLRRERDQLFPDEAFDDRFEGRGVARFPVAVAVVMVLQRLERLSSREAVERCCFDNRWRHAAGVGGYETNG